MRIKFWLLLTATLLVIRGFGQDSRSLQGKVVDTTTHLGMKNATIVLLSAKDSMMDQYARSDSAGVFSLKNVDTGSYILMISYPEFADYVEKLHITPQFKRSVGAITLVEKLHLLEDVIVRQQIAAIRFKGDTTEFNADSFRTQPNASVEDLLKKLPGIQVDKHGKITAQGETVSKVLVDGEEFFGDDPTLVTKNLRADMIDKVQLFDKTSDQAAFTGIDDGERQKTLNLKLKEDKKNGYFGKLTAAVGTGNFYSTQGMFNYFKGKRKFSAYGTFANTGQMSLGFDDQMKYGSIGNNMQILEGGTIMIFEGSDDALTSFDGRYDGHGIPIVNSGGLHFDDKWNQDRDYLNLNYKLGGMSVSGINSEEVQRNLPGGVLYNHNDDDFKKRIFRQKLDASYEVKLDSNATLKIDAGGSISNNSTYDHYNTLADRGINRDTMVSRGNRVIDNDGHDKAFSINALWMQKFRKKGRTLSLNISQYLKNGDISGILYSKYDYYNENQITSSKLTDQLKSSKSRSSNLDAKLTYSEPLSKRSAVVFNYGVSSINANADVKSYNKTAEGYKDLDPAFSNHYQVDQFAHNGGAAYSYTYRKFRFNAGTNISAVNYTQTDEYTGEQLARNFINWNPSMRFSYNFSQGRSFRLNYYGSTTQPTLSQLQPVQNNTDDQNIYVGNPDLKPEFNNRFSMNFRDSKILNRRYMGFYSSYSVTTDPIVTSVTTDLDSGKSVYQYQNLGRNTANYNGQLYYNRKLGIWDMDFGVDFGFRGNKYVNYANAVFNDSRSNNYELSFMLQKQKENVLDCSLTASASYTKNTSTLNTQTDNSYWSYTLRPNFDFFLPGRFQVHTDLDYNYQAKTTSFDARNQSIWNMWVGKKFFKKENLLLKIAANDILDQSKGFDRSVLNNQISQRYYTTIHRYFMVSLTWDFNKMGGAGKDTK